MGCVRKFQLRVRWAKPSLRKISWNKVNIAFTVSYSLYLQIVRFDVHFHYIDNPFIHVA